MKKGIQYLAIISLALSLTGCAIKKVKVEQTVKNLETYEIFLILVAQKYSEVIFETFDPIIEDYKQIKDLAINMRNGSEIRIRIKNTAMDYGETFEGPEQIFISYKNSESTEFNVPLFVDIVNSISGKKITEKFCFTFLEAPEDRYSPSRYDINKLDNELVFKYEFLDWFEDWSIGYHLYKDYSEELTFWGFSKQSTK